jgi:hypothetical protein
MYEAAQLGLRLRRASISMVEFGVTHGGGLIAIEELARDIRKLLNIQIEIFGFDTGEGLPTHQDYRDLPYVWRRDFNKMDIEDLRRRLPTAQLILGNVRDTVLTFLQSAEFPPIGFVSFDLDYYTPHLARYVFSKAPTISTCREYYLISTTL